MKAGAVMADGPYRYVRNPLYLGLMVHGGGHGLPHASDGRAVLHDTAHPFFMSLILGEEAFLSAQLGEPYKAYLRAVPRLIPRLRTTVPA